MTDPCIHDISWTNGWNVTKLAWIYHWDKLNSWLDFGDLIFKVTGGLLYVKNSLKWYISCIFVLIPTKLAQLYLKDNLKSLLYIGDLDPIFKVTSQLTKVDFIAKTEIFLEQMDGYSSNLSGYIVVTELRHVRFLVTLTPFSIHSLVCRISLEPVNGFSPNLYRYTTRTILRAD